MGIKERRDRERNELRQAILTAAREIAAQEGWPAVTIRKVAERIEYSPPTIYEHFASKEAMLLELMREGFRKLLDELRAHEAQEDPEAALMRIALVHWEFAWNNPELYQVMHGLGGVPFCPEGAVLAEAEQAIALVVEAVRKLAQGNGPEVEDPRVAMTILWATIHGLVSLTMCACIGDREQGRRLVEQAVQTLLRGWRGAPHPTDLVREV